MAKKDKEPGKKKSKKGKLVSKPIDESSTMLADEKKSGIADGLYPGSTIYAGNYGHMDWRIEKHGDRHELILGNGSEQKFASPSSSKAYPWQIKAGDGSVQKIDSVRIDGVVHAYGDISYMFGAPMVSPSSNPQYREIDLTGFDTHFVRNMDAMFANCPSLSSLDLGDKFDTSNVTSMQHMFYDCSSLASLDLGDKFDTSNVTSMERMFYNCASLTSLDLSDKFDTSNVTDMSEMFYGCSSLASLDLGDKFDTSDVTDMSEMFEDCISLQSLDLGDKFDLLRLIDNGENVFGNCPEELVDSIIDEWKRNQSESEAEIGASALDEHIEPEKSAPELGENVDTSIDAADAIEKVDALQDKLPMAEKMACLDKISTVLDKVRDTVDAIDASTISIEDKARYRERLDRLVNQTDELLDELER